MFALKEGAQKMSESKQSELERESDEFLGISIKWWFVWLAIAIATTFAVLIIRPYLMNLEYKGTRSSDSYVTTQQTALVDLKTEYDTLTVKMSQLKGSPENKEIVEGMGGQQKAFINQMKQKAALIPGKVPDDIQKFLDEQK